ncbi:MAG: 4Fe-4S binding protein [Eubacteriales bacterium]
MDLSVYIGGVQLRSPIITASGIDGMDGERINVVSKYNLGAMTTKTIVANVQRDVVPNMKLAGGGSLINCVFGANLTAEQWIRQEFPLALKAGVPIIANLAGTHPAETVELAKSCADAGATFIELPTACPHMANVLEAMYPGLKMPLPEVHDPSDYAKTVEAVKKAVKIPVICKFSAIYHYNVKTWAKAVAEAGADAISTADSIGPAMDIDIETGEPQLGGPRGYGGLTGPAIKPLVLKMVVEIAETVDLPIIAMGGVLFGADAIQYIMAGATAVAAATCSTLQGPASYARIYKEIIDFMDRKGYGSLDDFRGLTLRRIREREENKKQIIFDTILPVCIDEKCTGCARCVKSCPYGAIQMEGKRPVFSEKSCHGCGLCVSVCPTKALEQKYF